jgi:hypothetical protein
MPLPIELLKNVLMNITDEKEFTNLCVSSPEFFNECKNQYTLKELQQHLENQANYVSAYVNNRKSDVKFLFSGRDKNEVIFDTENTIRTQYSENIDIEDVHIFGRKRLYRGDDSFVTIDTYYKNWDMVYFVRKLIDFLEDYPDVSISDFIKWMNDEL